VCVPGFLLCERWLVSVIDSDVFWRCRLPEIDVYCDGSCFPRGIENGGRWQVRAYLYEQEECFYS